MSNTIIVGQNTLEPETWKTFHTEENVLDFWIKRYKYWPASAKIYHKAINESNNVTPKNASDLENVSKLSGVFYIIEFPSGFELSQVIGSLATKLLNFTTVSSFAVYQAMKPNIPSASQRMDGLMSPNNELSSRQNTPRPNARIPEIFGTVRSVPDLLSTYKVFENNQEIEYSYMCVGRGEYEVSDIRDDTTLISNIAGTSVEVYPPFESPNGGTPQVTIGSAIMEPLWVAKRATAVNGQVLRAPNADVVVGFNNIRFNYPDEVEINPSSTMDFTKSFQPGDMIEIINADYTDGITTVNLDGNYIAVSVTAKLIVLSNPAVVNSDWNNVDDFSGQQTGYISPSLETNNDKFVGNFDFTNSNIAYIYCNFVALGGIYMDNGLYQWGKDVDISVGVTPIDINGTPAGAEEVFSITMVGSYNDKGSINATLKCELSTPGRCRVRAWRTSPSYVPTAPATVIDEIKWRDLYAMVPVVNTDFGNCTTVHSATYATASALAIKERKLNMIVTRMIPERISGSTFTTENFPTNRADEILSFICTDSRLGNRNISEIDFDSIYDTIAEVETYFGSEKAIEFCYTFDSENISFEEMLASVSNAVFCNAYRRGNKIKLSFENETDLSTILFNHRNKLPGSEKRDVIFGNKENFDGLEFEYVDPKDDAVVTLYLPDETSPINPSRVQSVGIRNKLQAYFHAWRTWQKIKYQSIAVEFEATQEADILVRGDRILVADNTRTATQDGEVIAQAGTTLTLSQNVNFAPLVDYSVFLQYPNGTVESIGISEGASPNEIILDSLPSEELALDEDLYARTTYWIVGSTDARERAFLVTEKSYQSNFTSAVKALNYDERYYAHDADFVNDIVDEDGNLTG